jgi:hypothetical protein
VAGVPAEKAQDVRWEEVCCVSAFLRTLFCSFFGANDPHILFHRNDVLCPRFPLLCVLAGICVSVHIGLEGFRQICSFIVVFEQLIVCVQYIKSCLIVDVTSNPRHHV